jgi:hypothetical protein
MKRLISVRRVSLAVILLALASTVQASGFTLNTSPRTHPDISTEAVGTDLKNGAGLLTVCAAMSRTLPNPDPNTVTLTGAHGCGAVPPPGLAFERGIGLDIADSTTLWRGPLADFDLSPADAESSPAIFRFLASLTTGDRGLGLGAFTDAEIDANRLRAADFLAWFRSETEVAEDAAPVTDLGGFSLLRIVLAGLAAVAVVAEIIFLVVSFLHRRSAKELGQER